MGLLRTRGCSTSWPRSTRPRIRQRAQATSHRIEETPRDDDALRAAVGLGSGVLAGVVVWALIGAAILAVYQLTPSALAAMVQRLFLVAG